MKPDRVQIDGAGAVPPLAGELTIPEAPVGIVLFAHGSGSGHESPADHFVAAMLHEARLATLLFGLLGTVEARTHHNVFDQELLAARLAHASRWVTAHSAAAALPLGYFGADTGAAAALIAAAREPASVGAIVSRGGYPDLAWSWLHLVRAPTLLLVGEADAVSLESNQQAHCQLKCEKEMIVIPGATHLFSAPGALNAAAEHARRWFLRFLAAEAQLQAAHPARQRFTEAEARTSHGPSGRRA